MGKDLKVYLPLVSTLTLEPNPERSEDSESPFCGHHIFSLKENPQLHSGDLGGRLDKWYAYPQLGQGLSLPFIKHTPTHIPSVKLFYSSLTQA